MRRRREFPARPLALPIGTPIWRFPGDNDAAAAFAGAYDDITNLVHVYEIARRTLTAYTGNLVRLRRDSDDAESDFGYDADGNLDTAAITTWLGGATGYVVTVYDQAAAGDDITQATSTNQQLYEASAQNGRPGLSGDGTKALFGNYTNGGQINQPNTLYAVAAMDASVVNDSSTQTLYDGVGSSARHVMRQNPSPNPDGWDAYAGSSLLGGATDSGWHIWAVLYNGASSQFWIDNASQADGDAGAHPMTGLAWFSVYNGANKWTGKATALLVVDADATQRLAIQTALNDYYGVY